MKAVTAKFARIKDTLPYIAIVSLILTPDAPENHIEILCDGVPGISQGDIEEATLHGYEDWKQGAQRGVLFALNVANQTRCHVAITKIQGMLTDTNPTIVGAAAMLATWEALAFTPPQEIVSRVEGQVFASWKLAWDAVPEFVSSLGENPT